MCVKLVYTQMIFIHHTKEISLYSFFFFFNFYFNGASFPLFAWVFFFYMQ